MPVFRARVQDVKRVRLLRWVKLRVGHDLVVVCYRFSDIQYRDVNEE